MANHQGGAPLLCGGVHPAGAQVVQALRDQIIRNYEEDGEPDGLFAVESYRKRAQEGRLPKPIDPLHRIADFSEDGYGAMRFTL